MNILPLKIQPRVPLIIMFIFFFAAISMHMIQTGRAMARIQHHGQRVMATVTNIHRECGKGVNNCAFFATYQFVPYGMSPRYWVTGEALLISAGQIGSSNYFSARSTGQVPVAYEIEDPHNSAANFSDKVFTDDPMKSPYQVIGIAMGVFGGFSLLLELFWRMSARQAIRSKRED